MGAPTIVKGASELEYINSVLDQVMKMQGGGEDVASTEIHKLINGTSEEYQQASVAKFKLVAASFLSYLLAVLIIAYIVVTQTCRVIRAAGLL